MRLCYLLILVLLPAVIGGTLKGTVYDFSLDPVEGVVTINTTPSQREVADPEYSFEVEPGRYALTAERYQDGDVESATTENITVDGNGVYVLDLVLFPDVAVNRSLNSTVHPEEFSYWEPVDTSLPYLAFASLALIVWALYYSKVLYERDEVIQESRDDDASAILDFIDDNERVTQKEIREAFPFSQSKISLILTDLEDQGEIRKVKRGRGNVIIRE